jgi:hypothetical protein
MAGAISGTFTRVGRPQIVKLVLACEADSADHTFLSTTLNDLAEQAGFFPLEGLQLHSIKCIPDAVTPPTGGSSVTITDEFGVDLLGGKGEGMISATDKTWALFGPSGYYVSALITGDITLSISGNSVNSAKLTIVIEFTGE